MPGTERSSCRAADAAAHAKLFEVEEAKNLVYCDGPAEEARFHKLDLFTPMGAKDFPVVVFVHGGMWVIGDKADLGMYVALGRRLASRGIGCASINYRLSPKVKHPAHIQDVARAFAWVHRNIGKYGGRADRVFVCGHSAGGHLAALLATDETYLKAEQLSLGDVRGAIPISGVYEIPQRPWKEIFGDDAEVRRLAAPAAHVHAGCPPFLIMLADRDFPSADRMAERFRSGLADNKVPVELRSIPMRNHIDIIFEISQPGDPCGEALIEFVEQHSQ